jgi:hypothetical protein
LDQKDKIKALVFLGAALAGVILLAMGLANLEFTGGMPFRISEGQNYQGPPQMLPFSEIIITFLRMVGALLLLAVPVYLIMAVFNKQIRKRLVRDLMLIAGYLLILRMVRPREIQALEELEEEGPPAELTQPELPSLGDPVDFYPPETPDYLVLIVIVSVSLLLSTAAILLYIHFQRKKREQYGDMGQLAAEAQEAVDSLRAGEDFKDTILRCYYRMSTVLQREKRIQRQDSMTPREFERALSRLGMPVTPVRNLTRLFEDVRYGSQNKGKRDEELAVLSLMEIVEYCKNPGTDSRQYEPYG